MTSSLAQMSSVKVEFRNVPLDFQGVGSFLKKEEKKITLASHEDEIKNNNNNKNKQMPPSVKKTKTKTNNTKR